MWAGTMSERWTIRYMEIVLIRHGATAGNIEKRYIGITDENLCDTGTAWLYEYMSAGCYPQVQELFVSPLKRCRQTATIIYPSMNQIIVPDFKECNFGRFEGKNYKELSGDEDYQKWIDSNATLPFPHGEDIADFKKRSVGAWRSVIKQCRDLRLTSAACIVHGGTIMAVLSEIYGGDYYDYHCGNGEGYVCDVDFDGNINTIEKITDRIRRNNE